MTRHNETSPFYAHVQERRERVRALEGRGGARVRRIAGEPGGSGSEQLVTSPVDSMAFIYDWLGIEDYSIDPDNLGVLPGEADSYYRYKYTHRTYKTISAREPHVLPFRVDEAILRQFSWFFKQFYPEVELPARSARTQFWPERNSGIVVQVATRPSEKRHSRSNGPRQRSPSTGRRAPSPRPIPGATRSCPPAPIGLLGPPGSP